jgi:hypothetical protein
VVEPAAASIPGCPLTADVRLIHYGRTGQPYLDAAACARRDPRGGYAMIQPGSKQDKYRRRRVAAYRLAAAVHDQAAQAHEAAVDVFDSSGKPALAERERRLAARERQNATAGYGRAAALQQTPSLLATPAEATEAAGTGRAVRD